MALMTNINVEFISLVRKGANKKTVILKSNGGAPENTKVVPIKKTDKVKHLVYGIAYSPDEVDTDGDFSTAEEIEKASQLFMKNSRSANVDKQHSFEKENGAFVAENWIVKDGDPVFPDEPAGSWAMGIKIEDEGLWKELENGDLEGLSIGGFVDKIEKSMDFVSEYGLGDLWSLWSALERVVGDICRDETVTDKKAAISESIDQFKDTLLDKITKEKKSQKFDFLAAMKNMFLGETDMKKEEVEAIAKSVAEEILAKAAAPSKDEILAEVVKGVKAVFDPLEARLAVIEKATPGSAQGDGNTDDEPDYAGLGAEIAKAFKGDK